MAHVVPDLPSTKASQAAFSTYYLALVDDYDPVKSGMTAFEEAEMEAALALITKGASTNITKLFAVDSGSWNTAGNWYPSGVPGTGAIVCIPEGTVCTYALDAPTTELFAVRVDGTLKTDPTVDTAMLFDTMVVTPMGLFQDGTRTQRVASGVTHEWIIATSNGAVDVAWDTFFQSRGIIWMGETVIWGQAKTPFLEVSSYTGPGIGATSLTLASTPSGWAIGDECYITAMAFSATTPQNEEFTLTSVSGADIGWTGGLTYSHAGAAGVLGLRDDKAYVGNLTRNIRFFPDDAAAPIHHRGHLMQMHNPANVQMFDFEIEHLGRTAKHGASHARIFAAVGTITSGTPVDLTGSDYWNGSAIVLGPTFQLNAQFTAPGAGTLTIEGTDHAGDPLTVEAPYDGGFEELNWFLPAEMEAYFLSITSITASTNMTGACIFDIRARSRQMNENGVRNLATVASPSTPVYTTLHNTDNIQGRYPMHWHKLGILGDILLDPPIMDGVAIHDSPGWLMAQHQTHGHIKNCVGFNAPGAGFVAEDGNETGIWDNIMSAGHIGNDDPTHKEGHDLTNKDPARDGAAFAFTGRLIRSSNLVAAGSAGGFIFNVRPMEAISGVPTLRIAKAQLDQPTTSRGADNLEGYQPPIAHFQNNRMIALKEALLVTKPGPQQGNDLRTMLTGLSCYNCTFGILITYTAHYTMPDMHVVDGEIGALATANASDQCFVRPICVRMTEGIDITHEHLITPSFEIDVLDARYIIDAQYSGCTDDLVGFDISALHLSGGTIVPGIDQNVTSAALNDDPVALTGLSLNTGTMKITATKHDSLGDVGFPNGDDNHTVNYTTLIAAFGYYVDTDTTKYIFSDEWFSDRVTGETFKTILPIAYTGSITGITNHGACDLSNNTGPVIADFSVSMVRNTNLTVDVVGRATGNTPRFGGCKPGMKTQVVDNGDGTITLVPAPDENYTETIYVWIDDQNANTTRATMTVNVNKMTIFLGRADLLAA